MLAELADRGLPTSPGMPLARSTTGAEAGRGAYRMRPAEPHKAGHGGSPEGGGELAPEPSPLVKKDDAGGGSVRNHYDDTT